MAYTLRYSKRFAKAFKAVSAADRKRIAKTIEKLAADPFHEGKSVKRLRGPKDEFYRLRVGDWRILYDVSGEDLDILDLVPRGEPEKAVKRL